MKSLKKLEDLKGFWPYNNFGDKELKSKYFKIELADMSNEIDKKLFEQIFGHTLIKLANKVINTKNKEEYKIIVKNINKKMDKLFEMDDDEWADLYDAANLIPDINKIWFECNSIENIKIKKSMSYF